MTAPLSPDEKFRRALIVAAQRARRAHHHAWKARQAISDLDDASQIIHNGSAKAVRTAFASTVAEEFKRGKEVEHAAMHLDWTLRDLCRLMGIDLREDPR